MADKTAAGENTANGQIPNGGATAAKSPMQANLVMGWDPDENKRLKKPNYLFPFKRT